MALLLVLLLPPGGHSGLLHKSGAVPTTAATDCSLTRSSIRHLMIAMEGGPSSRMCGTLPLELRLHVLSFLPPNDLALGGRLSCKDAAQHFSQPLQRTVGLGQPLSAHAAACWQEWGEVALRELTLRQKLQLLTTAANSGCETNFESAWQLLQPHVFPELLQTDHYCNQQHATAADLGPAVLVGGLGHLLPSLAQRCPGLLNPKKTLTAAAVHCDLAGLEMAWGLLGQRFESSMEQDERFLPSGEEDEWAMDPVHRVWLVMLKAAARSTTPDAVAKLEWVLQRGGEAALAALEHKAVCGAAASTGDMARVHWLRERGFPWGTPAALDALLEHAELAFIQQLEEEEGWYLPHAGDRAWDHAKVLVRTAAGAFRDSAGKLRWLESKGARLGEVDSAVVLAAAEKGNLEALQLLKERLTARGVEEWWGPRGGAVALCAAVRSGSISTASWLRQQGCEIHMQVFMAAIDRGDLPMLRWLLLETSSQIPGIGMIHAVYRWPKKTRADDQRLAEALQLLAGAVSLPTNAASAEALCKTAVEGRSCAVWRALRGLLPATALQHTWCAGVTIAAVATGCEATLEALEIMDIGDEPDPPGLHSTWYATAAKFGDRGTLSCLQRLGVPLGDRLLVMSITEDTTPLPAMRWLVEQGAPASPDMVRSALEELEFPWQVRQGRERQEVEAWLRGLLGNAGVGAGAAAGAAGGEGGADGGVEGAVGAGEGELEP